MKCLVVLSIFVNFSSCRDFAIGMFKKNDLLVAQDTIYKEATIYGFATAKYGRLFHCPITYFRVVDRLGVGRSPSVKVTRGGIQKKYVTLLLTASYGQPIAVNIYVGCENKMTTQISTTQATTITVGQSNTTDTGASSDAGATTVGGDTAAGGETTVAGAAPGGETTAGGDTPAGGETTAAGAAPAGDAPAGDETTAAPA